MKKLLTIGLGLILASALANATVVGTGTSVVPNAVASAVGAGSTTLLSISNPYVFPVIPGSPADISGTYIETAYADTTNPFGAGDTSFVLTLTACSAGCTATIETATLANFTGFATAVSYLSSSTVPSILARKDSLGNVIGFDFTGLKAGDVETLIVYTDGKGAKLGGLLSIQNGSSGFNTGLLPTTAVPEPISMTLVGGGLALLGLLRFRRKS